MPERNITSADVARRAGQPAAVAGNDHMATEVIGTSSLRIPEDLSVVGFDEPAKPAGAAST